MRITIPVLLLVPAAALASSAFDGTWKTRLDSMKTTGKADQFQVLDGIYTCTSCAPEIKVKAINSACTGTAKAITPSSTAASIRCRAIRARPW